MSITSYADSALSLLPPLVAITLSIITQRVLLSLGLGIVVGAVLLNINAPLETGSFLFATVSKLFWSAEKQSLNAWNLYILGFLVILGMITALITVSGAARAFAQWASKHIRNKRDANLLTVFLGCVVFIDDYFNSLVVGSIARPLTDRYGISRSKLAYLLDSTAAPVCVISPISSWGAYIIAIIGGILTTHGLTELKPLTAFLEMIPMNFYAILTLVMIVCISAMDLDFGPMRKQELAASKGELFDAKKGVPPGTSVDLPEAETGKISGLFIPITVLVVATLFFMFYSGSVALKAENLPFSFIAALEKTDVSSSLFFGALSGLAVTLALNIKQKIPYRLILQGLFIGLKSMLPAIYILVFAWSISSVISQVETGKYMASLASGNISTELLPALLFVLAGIAAFSTGTSWGTFGILLPIAADMAVGTGQSSILLPMLAAVLAGAVFGDHCSPISDTTILSSTGASCHHIDHVMTQLPYAFLIAAISLVGYIALGYTGSYWLGLIISGVILAIILLSLKIYASKLDQVVAYENT